MAKQLTMFINKQMVFKILPNCTFLPLFLLSFLYKFVTRRLCVPGSEICMYNILGFTFDIHKSYMQSTMRSVVPHATTTQQSGSDSTAIWILKHFGTYTVI